MAAERLMSGTSKAIDISISVVSHGQRDLVAMLLRDLKSYCANVRFELILTLNLSEEPPIGWYDLGHPAELIRNFTQLGFGANHNQAFARSSGRMFCVLNPDIRFASDPFHSLVTFLENLSVAMVAPVVVAEDGSIEQSARIFPTPWRIAKKIFNKSVLADYCITEQPLYPDWVGGMFMLFQRQAFEQLHGFDEHYFLYYEDVDICARLRHMGHQIAVCPDVSVIHCAQRRSHHNLRFLAWHFTSMGRFFLSPVYKKISRGRHR
jgi:N-acetylglucosaminyl-diphospho-decaprenol L-rhamnosyltransferase